MHQSDPNDLASNDLAKRAGELDDLPDVPDVPDEPPGGDGPIGSDDDAIRKINRRVSPIGWLLIVSVLGVGGGAAYYGVTSEIQRQHEEAAEQQGRRDLQEVLGHTDYTPDQIATRVRAIYTASQSDSVKASARRVLAGLHDPQSVPMLIEGLAIPGNARAQAALGLAEIGLPAAESARSRLMEVLPTCVDPGDKVEVTWALVALNEPRAWPTVRQMLEANRLQEVAGLNGRRIFDPGMVARVAGVQNLRELSRSRSQASKRLAVLSLAELATPDVIDELTVLSTDSDIEIAREAAIGLGRTGEERAAHPIMEFLNRNPNSRDSVVSALAASVGVRGLSVLIHGSTDLSTRAASTRLLRDQRDPDAGDALFEALGASTGADDVSKAMHRNAVFGLAEIGDPRAVDGLMEYATFATTHLDPNSTQEAKLALEQIRHIPGAGARAKTALLALLRDPHGDFVRTQTLLALGTAGDPSVGAEMLQYLGSPDSQEGAAVALCALHNPEGISRVRVDMRRPPNLRMVDETVRDEEIFIKRRNAIRGIAWSGDARVAPDLYRIIDDADDRRLLREEAGFALAAVADDAVVNEVATRALDTSRNEEARMYYVWALRGRSTPPVSLRLVQTYLRHGVNSDLMKAAAIAAGFGGDDTLSDPLIALLTAPNQDPQVKYAAAVATILGGNARAANTLIDILVGDDQLVGILQNEFAPRSTNPNAATAQENWLLLPLTRPMFTDGRVFRRLQVAQLLEQARAGKHFGFAQTQLMTRLRSGWESAIGLQPTEVRALLREAAMGTDAQRQDMALFALRALNDRGSLLALKRQTRNPAAAERARRELVSMSASGG